MLSISSSDSAGDDPGLWSVASAQQHGHRAGRAHRSHSGLRQMLEVVAAQRAVACGQRCPLLVAELLGVELDRQPERARGLEDALRLLGREADRVAEGIHCVHQPGRLLGPQPSAHGVDVGIGAACVFRRQRVCTQ
jgi:hypothetical protein